MGLILIIFELSFILRPRIVNNSLHALRVKRHIFECMPINNEWYSVISEAKSKTVTKK